MNIDHLVYAVPDLETGLSNMEVLLGVRPVIGGHHPDFGTHNALLSLGTSTYLEVIAPDPDLPTPGRGLPFGITRGQQPRIATWALRTESIHELADAAVAAGINIGTIASGNRRKPDGTLLSWELSDPYVMPFGGAIPFLISWGETPHPASATPRAGDLIGFRIEHPEAESVRAAVSALDSEVEIAKSGQYKLIATIKTRHGIVELQ